MAQRRPVGLDLEHPHPGRTARRAPRPARRLPPDGSRRDRRGTARRRRRRAGCRRSATTRPRTAGRPARAVRRCRRRCRWTPRWSGRCGVGSVGPMSRPEASCTNVRSPIRATVRPVDSRSCASAAPMAVDTVPSIPATPRLDRTVMPWVSSPTSATSRTGLDAPSTSWSPGRRASATAAATCRPVVSGCASSWPCTAGDRMPVAPRRSDAATPGSGSPVVTARVPVACELPDTSGQRGPVVSANTGTDGSASSADTGRCRVGRPSMITCCGRSSGSASGCSGLAGGGAVGSATVGSAARFGCTPAPCPAITTVSGVRSMSRGWSNVTGGV